MPSKLLAAAHWLLEIQTDGTTHSTVKDEACHVWLRDTPLKALHPSRHVLLSQCVLFSFTIWADLGCQT